MLISIVVPVYREEKNIPEFLSRVVTILEKITSEFEIIFSMDPSPDRTEEIILEHRSKDQRIKLLKFSRRFGQPMATLAGLQYAGGDAVIVMDVDLQDPPELLAEMVAKWQQGYDVIYAQRRGREGETGPKRVVASLGYKLINRIAEVRIPPNTGDFRLMSRRVVEEVNRLKECHGFLRGMVALVGFQQTSVLFDRPARFEGAGNYNRFLDRCASASTAFLLLQLCINAEFTGRVPYRRKCLFARTCLPRSEDSRNAIPAWQPHCRHTGAVPWRRSVDQRRYIGRIHRPDL